MFRQCPTAPATRGQIRGWLVLAGLIFLAVAAGSIGRSTAETEEASVTVLAAGDIAFCERDWGRKISDWLRGYSGVSGAPATAALLERLPGAVLALGDLAYWEGTTEEFRDCYDRSWGRYKDRTYPVPGNHEYRSPEARPYFDYWGARAGAAGEGYYSFERGGWHIVALNSNIAMEEGSEQETWLRRDLAASSADCILAYWHHPPFSSGRHGDQPQVRDLYRALYEAGASVVLAGHDHHYERFEPMDPEGRSDPKRGLRSFVVGTGGGQLKPRTIRQPPRDKSEVIEGTTWGVLELTLHPRSYAWRFVPVEGAIFEDSGRSPCVERGPGG
jgi:3',5'-cyclic AMP phosphodiesterase CpdA